MFTKVLPNFKLTLRIVGITFILLAISLFSKGLMKSMAQFQVPEIILSSPHYYDALLWVYVHMTVLGVLIVLMASAINTLKYQRYCSLILFIVNLIYTFLDYRSADWALGNALYKGTSSLAPAIIGSITCLLFLQLSIRLWLTKENQ